MIERTFKSGDTLDGADVVDRDMQYLYCDGEFWHFMNPESFEQIAADATAVGDTKQWLKEQDTYIMTLWNGSPLMIEAPNTVTLKVTQTDPGIRGDTVTGGTKPATLETGAVVRVPLFIEEGDEIKVDTRKGEYLSRANKA